jgi:hypothetical protein
VIAADAAANVPASAAHMAASTATATVSTTAATGTARNRWGGEKKDRRRSGNH